MSRTNLSTECELALNSENYEPWMGSESAHKPMNPVRQSWLHHAALLDTAFYRGQYFDVKDITDRVRCRGEFASTTATSFTNVWIRFSYATGRERVGGREGGGWWREGGKARLLGKAGG